MKENRKKAGRPKSENPLNIDCKVRFSGADAAALDAYCAAHDTNRAAVIREATMQKVNGSK
jgi:hypothetical protein